jgi:ABC-type transport system involved in multi-copper enzyme maturation permease subunit
VTQTLAIFLDAYRELNARKMFWVTLILTVVFMLAFACFAPDGPNIRFLAWGGPPPFPFRDGMHYYKAFLLDFMMVGVWISWAGVILALIATAGIFPELISGGAIDLYLSKPMGRLRFFLTKYAASLLFVLLQSTVFSVLLFFIVGLRIGEWKWGLLLTIPLMTLFYSYIYCFCVLMGVWTRSLMAALTLTLLFWLLLFGLNYTELFIFVKQRESEVLVELHTQRAERTQREIDISQTQPASSPSTRPKGFTDGTPKTRHDTSVQKIESESSWAAGLGKWHNILFAVKTVLPKTSDTINLMSRQLLESRELNAEEEDAFHKASLELSDDDRVIAFYAQAKAGMEVAKSVRARTAFWVIGTSLGFELVILGLAGFIFCRRDY